MDFLDAVKGLISPGLISQTASQLGESESGVRRAMDFALPAVLTGVMGKLQEGGSSAEGVFSLLKNADASGLVNNLGDVVTRPASSTGLLATVFGDKLSAVSSALATDSGIKPESATSLMGLASAAVAGVVGSHVKTNGLDSGGLMGLLVSQKDRLLGMLPAGLSGLVGMGMAGLSGVTGAVGSVASGVTGAVGNLASGLGGMFGNVASGVTGAVGNVASGVGGAVGSVASGVGGAIGNVASGVGSTAAAAGAGAMAFMGNNDDEEKGGLGIWGLILPLLLLAGIAFFMLRGCSNKPLATVGNMADSTKNLVVGGVDSLGTGMMADADSLKNDIAAGADSLGADIKAKFAALGANVGIKLPDGTTLNAPEKGVEGQLVTFLMDPATKSMTAAELKTKWFDFDRILFDTGKSTIRSASQDQINNIAQILKAFPTLKLKFGGYTDNSGSKANNMKLSAERAKVVMMAVAQKDNAEARLTSEGYGPENPVAPNDTKANMEKNRRVSVRVVSL